MPTYLFRHPKTGERKTVTMTFSEYDAAYIGPDADGYDRYRVDGKSWLRDLDAEANGYTMTSASWPILSDAAGCLPEEVPENMEHARRCGVALNYAADGRPIFESPRHRKQALKALGMHDRDGYG